MNDDLPPVQFEIFSPTIAQLKLMKPVTVLDIFENNSENFHPQGLFSTEIFGRIGSPERDRKFSFVDIKAPILHPLYFRQLLKLKRLYAEIIAGKSYAVWDNKLKDFDKADEITGDTGYAFFLQHFKDIKFLRTGSHIRSARIDFLNKYRDRALIQYILILPAGLRDVEKGSDGRTNEGEINADYRRLISSSNAITVKGVKDESVLNNYRCSQQNSFNNIYNFYNQLISGKHGFIMSKWASRNIEQGTRSVITGASFSSDKLGEDSGFTLNSTIVGLYQILKAVEPVAINKLLTGYLSNIFAEGQGTANLIDKKTLKEVHVRLDSVTLDKWTTSAGITKLITDYGSRETRNNPVVIANHYLGLVYKDDKCFKVFQDIDLLPSGFKKSNVSPITYTELFYLCNFREWNKIPIFVTRYPITNTGSIYPSIAYVKATTKIYKLAQLDADWKMTDDIAHCYPETVKPDYIDSAAPHSSRLEGLTADYDGDTCSINAVYTKESVKEINDFLNSSRAYVSTKGGLLNSPSVDPVIRVIINMTGEPEDE